MKPAPQIALIAVTQKGVERARHLRQRLKTGEVYRPARYGPATAVWERSYDTALAAQVAAWFAQYDQLVFFLATGAVTRLIAPYLDSKTTDPGVLAVDEAGRFVIPVLSGHQGGRERVGPYCGRVSWRHAGHYHGLGRDRRFES